MSEDCPYVGRFPELDADRSADEQRRLESHLSRCEECRAQAAMDGLLRETLSDAPALALSESFDRRLQAAIDRRLEPRRMTAGRMALLGAYASAAAAATGWILLQIDWPSRLIGGPVGLGVVLLLAASPLLLLPRTSPLRPPGSG